VDFGPPPPAAEDAPPPPARTQRATEPPKDRTGLVITKPEIAEAFRRDPELKAVVNDLLALRRRVLERLDADDPLYADIPKGYWHEFMTNARDIVNSARPYAVCVYCAGEGCNACRSRGWQCETDYKAAPRERRRDAR
jgi:hypothetical protein